MAGQNDPVVVITLNADGVQNSSVPIVAIGIPYQLPDMEIPDGMAILIKSLPANTGMILVAPTKSSAADPRQTYPLRPGEFVSYRIKNAKVLWVSGTFAGDLVLLTAEKNEK